MTLAEDLRRDTMAGDEVAVAELCRSSGLAALKAIRSDIATLVEDTRQYDREIPWEVRRARASAAAIAACVSARTVAQAAGALDHPGVEPEPDRLAQLLVDISPKWLPKLGQRLLGNTWQSGWPLCYRLVARDACERPDDPRYVDQMISAAPSVDMLRNDPVLRNEVWAFFETDTRGLLLGPAWIERLSQLVEDGLLDRERLIDAALGALTMQAPWPRLTWFASFAEHLNPTDEIRRGHPDAYLALMRSQVPQVVAIAQRMLGPQLAAGELRPEPFLDVAGSPLHLKHKAVALEQLALLETLATDAAWVAPALDAVSQGFGHHHRDVQQRALRIVESHLDAVDADTRRTVEDRYELLPAALRPVLATTASASQPSSIRRLDAELGGPLSDDHFVEALASLMAGSVPSMDRLIEAAYRICGYPMEHRVDLMTPLLARREPQWLWDRLHVFGWRCARALIGEIDDDATRQPLLVGQLLDEAITTIGSGRSRPYVAMPTHPSGSIERDELARRLGNLPAGVGPAEIFAARLRADVDRELIHLSPPTIGTIDGLRSKKQIIPELTIQWRGPTLHCSPPSPFEYSSTSTSTIADPETGELVTRSSRREWSAPDRPIIHGDPGSIDVFHYLWYGIDVAGRATPWRLSLSPGYIDLGAIMALADFEHVMDHEPSLTRPNVLTPLLDRYVAYPPNSFGDIDAVTLACGMAAKPLSCRLAAVDALEVAVDVDACVSATGHWAGRLVVANALKLGRLADALEELMSRSPALARLLALRLLERAADQRDAHRVLDLTADAFALCGSAPLPDSVRQLATSTSSSKSAMAARRLVELGTND